MAYTDLSIVKNDGGETALWNRPIMYTLSVSNAGPDAANGATVVNSFPVWVGFITWTCAASLGSSCPADGSGNINASIDLAVGGTATFTAVGTEAYGTVGPITNTATVSSPIHDTNTANNTSTVRHVGRRRSHPRGRLPVGGRAVGVLFDNGPLITHTGGSAGGADASRLQNTPHPGADPWRA